MSAETGAGYHICTLSPNNKPYSLLVGTPLKDACSRLTVVRRPADFSVFQRVNSCAPPTNNFTGPGGGFFGDFPGDETMTDQFKRAPLVSLPDPTLWTGVATTKPLLRAPRNVRSDGPLCLSYQGARVLSPLFSGVLWSYTMSDAITVTARLFAATQGNFTDILDNKNGGPNPVTPGEVPSTMVRPETFGITV